MNPAILLLLIELVMNAITFEGLMAREMEAFT